MSCFSQMLVAFHEILILATAEVSSFMPEAKFKKNVISIVVLYFKKEKTEEKKSVKKNGAVIYYTVKGMVA